MITPRATHAEQLERSFARKLEQAIAAAETVRGRKITNKGLTEELAELGIGVAESHLSHLRRTVEARPSAWLVAGLAKVLDVPITYFVPEDPRSQADSQEMGERVALQSLGHHGSLMLWRAVGLSDRSLQMCLLVLAYMREQEGLPPIEEGPGGA